MLKFDEKSERAEEMSEEEFFAGEAQSTWQVIWKRFLHHKLARIGMAIMIVLILAAIFAPFIAKFDPTELHLEDVPDGIALGPNAKYWFGTDTLGRDYFSRALYGGRISLLVGFVSVGISLLIGVPLGCLAGYYGGWVDSLITRFTEFMMCLPIFFLILTINNMLPPNIFNVVAIIGAFSWMGSAKVIRGQVLYVKNMEYGRAAKALGLRDSAIIFKHILPNAMTPLIVSAAMGIANAIIMEAGLSYIGMGVQEPMPSWGSMLNASRSYMLESPHLALIPGTLICLVTLSLNFIGDGLCDAIDPKNAE